MVGSTPLEELSALEAGKLTGDVTDLVGDGGTESGLSVCVFGACEEGSIGEI